MSTVVVAAARPTQCRWSFHQLGDSAFPVAAAKAWNDDLPTTIRASPSLLAFRQQLKTFLFQSTLR